MGYRWGNPARASPWHLAARRCGGPPWRVPGRGSLRIGNLRMERGSSRPSSRRRGQHGVASPGHPGPCCLRPCGVTLLSCLGLCKASDQHSSWGGGEGNNVPMSPRSHWPPGKEAPWHIPGQGSAPAASVPGVQVLSTLLSPVPVVRLAPVQGHLGAGGVWAPAMPRGRYPAKRGPAPWHPRALGASVQCQRGTG